MFVEKVNYFLIDFSWVIGIILVVLLYLVYWYRRPYKFPPGPRGLPFVGYLPFMSENAEYDIMKLREIYGSILSVRMGPRDIVFLNDYKSIHKVLVKNGSVSSGRPRFPWIDLKEKGVGIGFADYHGDWKTQRKFGLKTLKGFGVGKKRMEKICLEEANYLNKEIQNHHGKPFDISAFLHNAIANMICGIVLGKRFEYSDQEFLKNLNLVVYKFNDPVQAVADKFLILNPLLKYVPPFYFYYKKSVNQLEEVFDWIKKQIEDHYKTYDSNNIRDFIDAFIKEKRKEKDSSFTDEQLLCYIYELFFAGVDTSSNTLYWGLLCLLHYPETQKKMRNEIKDVFGFSGTISMSNKLEMPYTCAFIHELMRFRTIAPFALPHKATADFYLNDYIIPEGTRIIPNIWAVHNDPNLWENPEIFNPERFLDKQGNFVPSNNMIPFSLGPRQCFGEQLARMEVFIFLVAMLQKFEFLPDPAAAELPNIVDGSFSITYYPKSYQIVAKEACII